jgi:uncharacterized cupin superfamily protein
MADQFHRASLNAEPEQRFIRLREALGVTTFGINGIVLEPGQRNRIHNHRLQQEVFLVLEGTLTLVVEGEDLVVATGELVEVPPGVRRQLTNRGPGVVRLLALGGMVANEHTGRDGEAFLGWDGDPLPIAEVPLPDDLSV